MRLGDRQMSIYHWILAQSRGALGSACTQWISSHLPVASLLTVALGCVCYNASCFAADSTPAPVRSPREMLQVMRIDESLLGFFRDDRPLDEDERELFHP